MVTVVIPCYNSENTIEAVVNEMRDTLLSRSVDYQFVLVCDGSPDNVFSVIKKLCAEDCNIIGVNLSRNFGQSAAYMAALPLIKGEYTVFMDDDGQHPAQMVFSLLDKLDEGYDVAFAHFRKRQHSPVRRLGDLIARVTHRVLIGLPSNVTMCSYAAMNTYVVKKTIIYDNPYPVFMGYVLQITKNIAVVEMQNKERISEKSNYNFRKLFKLWVSVFTSFSIKPLRIASFLGATVSVSGFLYGIYLIILRMMNPDFNVVGWTALMAALLFISGIILLVLGVIGEYVGRIYMAISRLPQYVVKEVIGEQNHDSSR